ncbi:MAG: UDP-galactopyranose mutase [Armatimonadota bacterium]|nr:UDP-galactopyranose mutase [Armatimonadota bacterium]
MKADWLIVGAGFTGSVLAERIAGQLDQSVLVVERRDHVGGNAFDEVDAHGILVHRYGPHIFHTNSQRVWEYLSQFTEWRPYEHRVRARVQGHLVPVPFNLTSLERLFPVTHAQRLTAKLVAAYGPESNVPILRMREASDPDIRALAEFVYDNVYYGYTRKQWGMRPEDLDASVTGRVPVRISYDDRYFQDVYQAMPLRGYTAMFDRMLRHPRITLLLGTDYRRVASEVHCRRIIYTGATDAFFDFAYGPLPYRSLRFVFETHGAPWVQEVATINYPDERSYTRTTEFKHLTGQEAPVSTTVTEYPVAYVSGENEPYYPIPRDETRERFGLYQREIDRLGDRVVFAGRLADYRYYNMDQAVARALKVFEEIAR